LHSCVQHGARTVLVAREQVRVGSYDDSSVSTALTLGSPVLSVEQRLARMAAR
jgi:hypothetical protein